MEYNDLVTFVGVLLAICGAISVIGNAYTTLRKLNKPNDDLRTLVNEHDESLKLDDEKIKSLEEGNRIMSKCLLALVNHEISGNDVKGLKEVRDELQQYLIDK